MDLFYSQRIDAPNKKKTVVKNVEFIKYVATRPGAVMDEELKQYEDTTKNENYVVYISERKGSVHSEDLTKEDSQDLKTALFGKIGSMKEIGNIYDLNIAVKSIRDASTNKKTIFKSLISFREEEAEENGFLKRQEWINFVSAEMPIIARENGIKISNLEWMASVHYKKGHPHCHLSFWDKSNVVQKQFVHSEVSDCIRRTLNVHLNKKVELNQLQALKTEKRNAIRFSAKKETMIAVDAYINLNAGEKKLIRLNDEAVDVPLLNLPFKETEVLLKKIYSLKSFLPKTGRLQYKLLDEDAKKEVDKVSKLFISSFSDLKKCFEEYMNTQKELSKLLYKDKPDKVEKYTDKGVSEALSYVGNSILNAYKKMKVEDFKSYKAFLEEQKELKQMYVENLIISFLNFFRTKTNQSQKKFPISRSLNKYARKELSRKMKDTNRLKFEVER